MIEPTVLLDPTRSVEETHLDLIANGTVAVVSAADFPPGKHPTDIVGRLIGASTHLSAWLFLLLDLHSKSGPNQNGKSILTR